MLDTQKSFKFLTCSSLMAFGFFGSLGFLLAFILLLVFVVYSKNMNAIEEVSDNLSVSLYLLITAVFFFLFFRGITTHHYVDVIKSLAPMAPLPILGLLLLFSPSANYFISETQISLYAKISVGFLSILIIFLTNLSPMLLPENLKITSRSSLLTGNPVIFSTIVIGLSLLCLTTWHQEKKTKKLLSFFVAIVGFYIAVFLTSTRGALITFLLIAPILIWYLSDTIKKFLLILSGLILLIFLIIFLDLTGFARITFLNNFIDSILHLTKNNYLDHSNSTRLGLWRASLIAITDAQIFGYGITEKMSAIRPHLTISINPNFSHPHNDIFAGTIGGGVLAGLFSLFSLCSPIFAHLFNPNRTNNTLFMAIGLSISFLVTANVNTIFFNDAACAWLIFSTFLIWRLKKG